MHIIHGKTTLSLRIGQRLLISEEGAKRVTPLQRDRDREGNFAVLFKAHLPTI